MYMYMYSSFNCSVLCIIHVHVYVSVMQNTSCVHVYMCKRSIHVNCKSTVVNAHVLLPKADGGRSRNELYSNGS